MDSVDTKPGVGGRWAGWLVGLLVFAAVLVLLVLSLRRSLARSQGDACQGLAPVQSSSPLPSVSVTRLRPGGQGLVPGGEQSLVALSGRGHLVNFWSATCAPCVRELPSLVELARRAWPGALVLVCVDESLDEASRLVQNNPGLLSGEDHVLWLWDKGGTVARALGTSKFPETYFVRHGRTRWKVASDRDWMSLPARRCLLTHR